MPSAETFPSSLRAKGAALSTCSHWLNNFIIARAPRVRKGEFLVDQQKGLITLPLVQNTGQCSRLCLALIWSGSLVTYLFRIRSLRIFLGGGGVSPNVICLDFLFRPRNERMNA
jgi:hypothetical protein